MQTTNHKPQTTNHKPQTTNHKILKICILLILSISSVFIIDKSLFWRSQLKELQLLSSITEKIDPGKIIKVLIFGDSIIHSFPLKSIISQKYLFENHGIDGDSIKNISKRYINEHDNYHQVVIFEGGINDIIGWDVENRDDSSTYNYIIDSYEKAIDHAIKNNVNPICLEILPVTHRFVFPFIRMIPIKTDYNVENVNDFIKKVNRGIRELCSRKSVLIIDTYSALTDPDGEADRAYMHADGYHVNINGYKKIGELINENLNEILLSK